jgi:hypothetical protein
MDLQGRGSIHWREVKLQKDKNGYIRVSSNKFRELVGTQLLHRIIALLFLPNPDNLPIVCHRDDNTENNQVSNLRWDTQTNNCKESWDKGNRLESIKKARETCIKRVLWYNSEDGREFYGGARELIREYPKDNLCYKCLSGVLRGICTRHKQWRIK